MQILSADVMEGRPTKEVLKDPDFNIKYGCDLLAALRARWDTQAGMLAAYFGAIDGNGRPNDSSDGSGVDGWGYVMLVEQAAMRYYGLNSRVDSDYAQYAPHTHTWREAAENLKGIATDALEAGRRLRDRSRMALDNWPALKDHMERLYSEIVDAGRSGANLAKQNVDDWGAR